MTDAYDNEDLSHRTIRFDIEQGDGIANLVKASEALAAMKEAGFEILAHEDLADRPGPCPWYWCLDGGSWRHAQTVGDLFFCLRMTRLGRMLTHAFFYVAETVGLAPPGATKMSGSLCTAAEALVAGGKKKLFTPMLLMVGRKP